LSRSIFTAEYERFRLLLIEARTNAGLSQAALSEKLSRPQSFVSKYERGERRLDVIEFGEVARALGIDPLEFLQELFQNAGARRR
jgi:transcriptional regulator with XRE-family HTH domain